MKINVLVPVAGNDFSYSPGVHNVSEEAGLDLIKAGHASIVKDADIEMAELDKAGLVELAATLGVGAPSTLSRWGEDRLREAILGNMSLNQ